MKAHILAEGLLKLIHGAPKYDGRFILVGPDQPRPINRPTGTYDRTILCQRCDNKLGKYDQAAIDFCQNAQLDPHPSGVAFTVDGFSPKDIKLFCMSYIWRASITSWPEFAQVNLGNVHEERIRTMLLNDDGGDVTDYTTLVSKFRVQEDMPLLEKHIWNPTRNKLNGINIVDVYLPNMYKVIVKVDQRSFAHDLNSVALPVSGRFFVADRGDYTRSREFDLLRRTIRNGR